LCLVCCVPPTFPVQLPVGVGQRADPRLAFEGTNGCIPPGAHILHRCDRPQCVNPAHLFAGSHLDNMRDMYSKGRRRLPTGERNGRAKLTAETVQAIRAATGLQREIGACFGVS
jgi:hypothetical protein